MQQVSPPVPRLPLCCWCGLFGDTPWALGSHFTKANTQSTFCQYLKCAMEISELVCFLTVHGASTSELWLHFHTRARARCPGLSLQQASSTKETWPKSREKQPLDKHLIIKRKPYRREEESLDLWDFHLCGSVQPVATLQSWEVGRLL